MEKIIVSLQKKEAKENLENWLNSEDRSGEITLNNIAEIAATGDLKNSEAYELDADWYIPYGWKFKYSETKNMKSIPRILAKTNYAISSVNLKGIKKQISITIKYNPTDEDYEVWKNIDKVDGNRGKIVVDLKKKEAKENLENWLKAEDRTGMITFNELAEIAATGILTGENKYELNDSYYVSNENQDFNLVDDKNMRCIPELLKSNNYCITFVNTIEDTNRNHYFLFIKKNPTSEDMQAWQNIHVYSNKIIRSLIK